MLVPEGQMIFFPSMERVMFSKGLTPFPGKLKSELTTHHDFGGFGIFRIEPENLYILKLFKREVIKNRTI